MSRRLPMYILFEASASMGGISVQAFVGQLRSLCSRLMSDPRATETLWLSLLTFGSDARVEFSLASVTDVVVPDLSASGAANLGSGLTLLLQRVESEVRWASDEQRKGDWKPIILVVVGSQPTDQWESSAESLKRRGTLLNFLLLGDEVSPERFQSVAESVIRDDNDFSSIFQFVTQSVGA